MASLVFKDTYCEWVKFGPLTVALTAKEPLTSKNFSHSIALTLVYKSLWRNSDFYSSNRFFVFVYFHSRGNGLYEPGGIFDGSKFKKIWIKRKKCSPFDLRNGLCYSGGNGHPKHRKLEGALDHHSGGSVYYMFCTPAGVHDSHLFGHSQ